MQLSPRLRWMRHHRAETFNHVSPEEVPWKCWAEDKSFVGFGNTELDAIVDFARQNKILLWNEKPV